MTERTTRAAMTVPLLLLTRPQDDNEGFVAGLAPDLLPGLRVVMAPLLQIAPVTPAPDCGPCDGAIFTSRNGVALAPDGDGRPAFCVGPRTAAQAAERGWDTLVVAATADELLAALSKTPPGGRVIHFAGKHRRGNIAERLSAAGMTVETCILYDQRRRGLTPDNRAELAAASRIIAPVFSPRTAEIFVEEVPFQDRIEVVALSPAVAAALRSGSFAELHICAHPNAGQMTEDIEKLLRRATFA